VFENRVLRIFGPKRDAVTKEWKRLNTCNEELSDLYPSLNIIRVIISRMRWARHVARMGERSGVYRVLVGKPEGKRPLERPRCRWEDNINPFQSIFLCQPHTPQLLFALGGKEVSGLLVN
jgi:hypothetical protein